MKSRLPSLIALLIFCSISAGFSQNCTSQFSFDMVGVNVSFMDQSTTTGSPIVAWSWDFDDGSTSNLQNPVHVFPEQDVYDVCLTITTANGCSDEFCFDLEICHMTVTVTQTGDCTSNGEIPIRIFITDMYDNARDVNVSIDGVLVPGSPFRVRDDEPVTINTFVPGDGLAHVIAVISEDVEGCQVIQDFQSEDCTSDCFISGMALEFSGGATHTINVGGNFFQPASQTILIGDLVNFQFIDGGHTTTSDATSGPDSWSSGELGFGATYPVYITNPGTHRYYCQPHGGPNGAGMSGMIIANCPPGGQNPVEVSFNTSIADPAGYNIKVDGVNVPGSPFSYSGTGPNSQIITIAGDGQAHTIDVQDVADPTCINTRTYNAPDCGAAPACSISFTGSQSGGCTNNQVPYELDIATINVSTQGFQVLVNGVTVPGGPFPYDSGGNTVFTVQLPGDGQAQTVRVSDSQDANCFEEQVLTTPNCSIPCELSNVTISSGSSVTHTVEVRDFDFFPSSIQITTGDVVDFFWTGVVPHTSTSDEATGPNSWSSGLLNQGAHYPVTITDPGNFGYYCVPHGAPGGVGMSGTITAVPPCDNGLVSVLVSFQASNAGFTGFNVYVDGNLVPGGPFAYDDNNGSNSIPVLVAGNGQSHIIEIKDAETSTCMASNSITTPDCNASFCEINANAQQNGTCNQGNVTVNLQVTSLNGGSAGFNVTINGSPAPGSPFQYTGNDTTIPLTLVGNGQTYNIVVTDVQDATCSATTTFESPDCSIPCSINNLSVSAGQQVTHVVEVRDFDFSPADILINVNDIVRFSWTGAVPHTSTSDIPSGPNSWSSGLQGQGFQYDVTITDVGVHPYYCVPHGAPGGVGMAGTVTAAPPCDNGFVQVSVQFGFVNGGANGYNILVDGQILAGSPFDYPSSGQVQQSVPVIGDGESHVIEVRDALNSNCTATVNIITPDCNVSLCEIGLTAQQNGNCDQGNVGVNLNVQSLNAGNAGFTVTVNGTPVAGSPFQYTGNNTTVPISVIGNGQTYNIAVADVTDPECSAMAAFESPDCTIPCSINNLSVSSGQQVTHIVEVRDFDFSPADILINVNDIVRFSWTGAVPHTSTSDIPSGPNSWSSGLQGQGFQYDVTITDVGVHPYYCVPHGAPGGVGMAGTVTAAPPCDNGFVQVSVQFGFVNGGANGYNILVDGEILAGSPFDYPSSGQVQQSVAVAGDGLNHVIEIRDVSNSGCMSSVNVVTPDCNVSLCQLNLQAAQSGTCDQGNVPVTLQVMAINPGSSGFIVQVDGQTIAGSPFSYDGTNTSLGIQVVGDGLSHAISVIDADDNSCFSTANVTTTNCNLPCQIGSLTVSAGQAVTHTVEVRDFDFSPQHISINAGDNINFVWTGAIAHTATTDLPSGPGSWNSGLQGQGFEYTVSFDETGVVPYYCIPHGAPGGVGMAGTVSVLPPCENGFVQVNISFEFSNPGPGGYRIMVDNVEIAGSPFSYPSGNMVQVLVPVTGDGQAHIIRVEDVTQGSCFSSAEIITQDCDVSLCQISASAEITGPCSPQQTLPVNLTVNALNPAGTNFNIYLNNVLYTGSSFAYAAQGATLVPIIVPGNGQTHTIRVEDATDPSCMHQVSLTVSDCNAPCVLSALTLSTGSPIVHTVDVEDFQFDPQFIDINAGDTIRFVWTGVIPHTATSSSPTGPGSFSSGLQGVGYVYDVPFPAPGEFPYYCVPHGTPTGIGMAGSITVNNNCNNGNVQVALDFQAQNTGVQGYLIFVDGVQVSGPHNYISGPNQSNTVAVPGDGMSHTIEIRDADYSDCKIIASIVTPDCGGGTICQIDASAAVGTVCDAQNRVEINLTVNHQNVGNNGFDVLVDGVVINSQGIPYSSGNQTSYTFSLAGTGANRQIQVRDAADLACNDTLMITLPSCGVTCAIEQLAINAGPGIHTVEVRDFDYLPLNAQVQVGDTVRFVWTGAIAHTVTSDQLNGPGSFNSGLLGTGATFDVVPTAAGNIGYFCIPHGGPGGIGMAGNIQVSGGSACVGDTAVLSVQFEVSNGSSLGYWIYKDGVKINQQPLHYQNVMGHNQTTIHVIGDGSAHFLTIQDVENQGCAATAVFEAPLCGAGCAVLDLELNTGEDIVHIVEVRDFDYLPEDIEVRTGETVRFDFTGVIPHTVTSDALQGPDVFNSGILGQGSSYEVNIQQTGSHPYYCIPHGGPSGIGMAGHIQASLSCDNGLAALQIRFRVTNGSPDGFRVFLDGILLEGSPFAYDDPKGSNELMLFLEGDGQQHIITIQDLDNPICAASGFVFLQNCTQNCSFNQVQIEVASGKEHEVLVRDFDFEPLELNVAPGDFVLFNWTGVVPHTVTSDNSTGPGSFNSGLLGQGSQYTLPVTDPGTISYYCIPHGSPGGIGMAGLIHSVEDCADDTLSMQLTFQTAADKTGAYQVMINGMLYPGGPFPYNSDGNQSAIINIPGDGAERTLSIIDISDPTCFTQISFIAPDCNNPCFSLQAGFNFAVDITSRSVQLTNTSTGSYDQINWTFGDGSNSGESSPSHTYDAEGSYEVCLYLANSSSGCMDTICKTVFIGGFVCQANFEWENKGLSIQFEDLSITSSPIMLRTWTFGDNNIRLGDPNPLHTYAGLGTYEVCLTITTAECESTICKTIDLSNPCVLFLPDFEYVPDQNQGFQFVDLSEGTPTSWLWGFGDGSTSNEKNPFHRYNTAGNYKVCLLVQREDDFCSKFICKEIHISTGIFSPALVNHKLKVYPNPVSESINHLVLEGVLERDLNKKSKLLIYDALGRTVHSDELYVEKSTSINLPQNLVKGIYFIELKAGERIYYASFMYQ